MVDIVHVYCLYPLLCRRVSDYYRRQEIKAKKKFVSFVARLHSACSCAQQSSSAQSGGARRKAQNCLQLSFSTADNNKAERTIA